MGHVRRGRTRHTTGAAAGALSRSTHSGTFLPLDGGEPRQGMDPNARVFENLGLPWGDARDGEQVQTGDIGPGAVDGATNILPGSLPASIFDGIPPAVPTDLALVSDVATNSDGTSFVRLLITLVQPTDSDLYGSYVDVTSENDGAGNPVWDRPVVVLITKGNTQSQIEDLQGATAYWARARAADVQGNFSAYGATIGHTTVGDTVAPPQPNPASVTPGFRGFSASWTGGDSSDLAYYGLRWAQAASAPDGDDDAWTYATARATKVFISDLTAGLLYWFEVRGVDLSGNESAWSAGVSVTPNLIGSEDIAANTITSVMLQSQSVDADKIFAGTLHISPTAGFADGIEIINGSGVTIGRWNELGLKIHDPNNTARYVILDGGQLKFTTDNGATFITAVTPDGINAAAITFGSSPGGHNVIKNSSFELSGFVSVPLGAVFTDNSGTPGWKAANRATAPINTTEGAANLAIAATGY